MGVKKGLQYLTIGGKMGIDYLTTNIRNTEEAV